MILNVMLVLFVFWSLFPLLILNSVLPIFTTHPAQKTHVMVKPLKYALMVYAAACLYFLVEALIWQLRKKRSWALVRLQLIHAGLAAICCGLLWLLSRSLG